MKKISLGWVPNEVSINEVREILKKNKIELDECEVNHCFLPKEKLKVLGYPLSVPLLFEELSRNVTEWHESDDLEADRTLMFKYLKTGGTAYLIAPIVGGVKLEKDLAEKLGVEVVVLD
jgi:hypothetical protein